MNMKFGDNTFDCVLDTFGLEYVLNPHKALSEIRRYRWCYEEFARRMVE